MVTEIATKFKNFYVKWGEKAEMQALMLAGIAMDVIGWCKSGWEAAFTLYDVNLDPHGEGYLQLKDHEWYWIEPGEEEDLEGCEPLSVNEALLYVYSEMLKGAHVKGKLPNMYVHNLTVSEGNALLQLLKDVGVKPVGLHSYSSIEAGWKGGETGIVMIYKGEIQVHAHSHEGATWGYVYNRVLLYEMLETVREKCGLLYASEAKVSGDGQPASVPAAEPVVKACLPARWHVRFRTYRESEEFQALMPSLGWSLHTGAVVHTKDLYFFTEVATVAGFGYAYDDFVRVGVRQAKTMLGVVDKRPFDEFEDFYVYCEKRVDAREIGDMLEKLGFALEFKDGDGVQVAMSPEKRVMTAWFHNTAHRAFTPEQAKDYLRQFITGYVPAKKSMDEWEDFSVNGSLSDASVKLQEKLFALGFTWGHDATRERMLTATFTTHWDKNGWGYGVRERSIWIGLHCNRILSFEEAMQYVDQFSATATRSVKQIVPLRTFEWKEYRADAEDQRLILKERELPQKIKALALAALGAYRPPATIPTFTALTGTDTFTLSDLPKGDMLFVRPCPFVPNHGAEVAGFSSEAVARYKVEAHIRAVQKAITEKEPNAAIMVMPYVKAELSAVAAPNQYIAIGKGHDGVTAGTSDMTMLPLAHSDNQWIRDAGEREKEVELEFVYGVSSSQGYYSNQPFLVQLRRAAEHVAINPQPTETAVPGFIPKGEAEITHVYVVKDLNDLGELEVLKEMDTTGLLVVQPTGSLLSHASAHCRGAGIPFVVDDPGKYEELPVMLYDAGGWVTREKIEGAAYDPEKYQEHFWKGVEKARKGWKQQWGKLSTFFHQYTSKPLASARKSAEYAGMFCGWLALAGNAANLGEMRHAPRKVHGKGSSAMHGKVVALLDALLDDYTPRNQDREDVYAEMLAVAPTWDDVVAVNQLCKELYGDYTWKGGFGGNAWSQCAEKTAALAEALSKRDFKLVLERANDLENASHNGGWLFNKHLDSRYFTAGTEGFSLDQHGLTTAFDTVETLLEIEKEQEDRPEVEESWNVVVEKARAAGPWKDHYHDDEDYPCDDEEECDEEEYVAPKPASTLNHINQSEVKGYGVLVQ